MTVGLGPATPAIYFLSDYGTADGFVGVVHAVLHRLAPGVAVIDLSHQVAPFDVAAGAALLARCAPDLGAGVVLAVVDPGVGTARRAVAIGVATDGHGRHPAGVRPVTPTWLLGPDNGLLAPAAAALGGAVTAVDLGSDRLRRGGGSVGGPQGRGPTFDGRDVFAPAAAHLAVGGDPTLIGTVVDPHTLVTDVAGWPTAEDRVLATPSGSALVTSVAAVDRFGNVELTALPAVLVEEIGLLAGGAGEVSTHPAPLAGPDPGADLPGSWVPVRRVVTFGDLGEGELGLIVDGSGRLALVLNRASAAHTLGLHQVGSGVTIRGVPPVGGVRPRLR